MVGFLGSSAVQISPFESILAGACSGITTRAIVSPLDVVKIRFQLQIEPIGRKYIGSSNYTGLVRAIQKLYHEEGVRVFWKGHSASQLLSISYGAVQFGAFEQMTHFAWSITPSSWQTQSSKPVISFFCGGLAGMVASTAAQPFDTVRTRMIMQREPKIYKSTGGAFRQIAKHEGYRGLWRGLMPNLVQVAPYASLQFGAYSVCTNVYRWLFGDTEARRGIVESFICGALSGMFAKTAVLPMDMVKKRLQVQGVNHMLPLDIPQYGGLRDCVRKIYRQEGAKAFYKGGVPSLVKAGVSMGLIFVCYEQSIWFLCARKARMGSLERRESCCDRTCETIIY